MDQHYVDGVDLRDGSVSTVSRTGSGYPWKIDTNGTTVVWAEWDPKPGRRSSWRIVGLDIATGETSVIDHGNSARTGDLYDVLTALDVQDDLLAYSVDAPTDDNPLASQIVVRRLSTGEPVRHIETELIPYDVAVSDDIVVYSEGRVSSDAFGAMVDTRLMISNVTQPEPRKLSDNAYDVALDGERLVWVELVQGGTLGPAADERVVMSTLPVFQPVELSRPFDPPLVGGSHYAVAGDGAAAWSEASEGAHHLIVWDAATGDSVRVADAGTVFVPSIGGGWLVWHVYAEVSPGREVNGIYGVSLDAVRSRALDVRKQSH